MFKLSNEMVEESPDLSGIQKIQFLDKLDF
jgi:hypothetical protein